MSGIGKGGEHVTRARRVPCRRVGVCALRPQRVLHKRGAVRKPVKHAPRNKRKRKRKAKHEKSIPHGHSVFSDSIVFGLRHFMINESLLMCFEEDLLTCFVWGVLAGCSTESTCPRCCTCAFPWLLLGQAAFVVLMSIFVPGTLVLISSFVPP